jgi:hypothetical protein
MAKGKAQGNEIFEPSANGKMVFPMSASFQKVAYVMNRQQNNWLDAMPSDWTNAVMHTRLMEDDICQDTDKMNLDAHDWYAPNPFEERLPYFSPKPSIPDSARTTLMVRNVPILYRQHMLVQEWPNNGTYDLLYLPFSSTLQRNLTYAFINFTSPAAAQEFKAKWQKMRLSRYTARKPLNVSFADVQGRDENLWQFRKKRLWRMKVQQGEPIIFEDGIQIPLSEALENLESGLEEEGFGW